MGSRCGKMFLRTMTTKERVERELGILGRLKNDAVIAPGAIVDGCAYDEDIAVPV